MATNWTLYEKKLKINGDTERERHISTVVNSINNDFSHSPSFQEVKINGVTTGVHILEDSDKADNVKNIVMKPSDILNIGSIIEWNSIKWLCTSAELYSGTYYYGKIQKCIYSLTYNKNGISYEIPYSVFDSVSLTRMGIEDNKYLNIPDSKMMIMTSDNESARLIQRDDIFTLYNKDGVKDNYKIIDINRVRMSGLIIYELQWTVEEVEVVEEPVVPPITGLSISPIDNFIYRNKTKVFTAKIFNNEVEDIVSRTVWILTNKDGTYNQYCTMTYNNRNCTLTASNESSHVGKVVILRLTLENDGSTYIEKEITIKSLV